MKFTKYRVDKEGNAYHKINGKLTPTPNNCHMGYLKVTLYADCGKRKTFLLHKLVWIYFNGSVPKGMQIDHIDDNHLNNKLSNLQLVTQEGNIRKRAGTISIEYEAAIILEYTSAKTRPYGFVTKLGRKYGVSRHVVNTIIKRNKK